MKRRQRTMDSARQATFYDEHPFDWVPSEAGPDIRCFVSPLLVDLIDTLNPNALVLDVGCGPGRVLGFLVKRGIHCIGMDRSRVSLGLAVSRHGCPGVLGDNLSLPFANGVADVLISDGVIHHTDDPRGAFEENLRILKAGGHMYLGVYKPSGRYPLLYRFPGAVIRRGLDHRWSRPFVIMFAMFPYFLVHFIRSKGKRTWAGARNLFYDYFITPRVAFLSREVIEKWCSSSRTRVLRYDESRGSNVHSFLLQKYPSSSP
jgi:SAM-dependent methyltransferase